MSESQMGRHVADLIGNMAAVHGFARIEDRTAEPRLSPAEQAVLAILVDRITDVPRRALAWIAEDITAAVRPPILREHEDIRPTGDTSSDGTAAGWVAASVASSWMGHDPGDLAARVLRAVRPLIESEALTRLADDADRIGRDAVGVAEIRARAGYATSHPRLSAVETGEATG